MKIEPHPFWRLNFMIDTQSAEMLGWKKCTDRSIVEDISTPSKS